MIDINKKYQTRDGREVVIYAVYPEQKFAVHGTIKQRDGSCNSEEWMIDGTYTMAFPITDHNLIEVQEPPEEVTVWINFYKRDVVGRAFFDKGDAQHDACFTDPENLIATKRVTIQYRPGEFDE
jgi:hypothetical protein